MPRRHLILRSIVITAAAFLVATGFGITLPLISLRLEATGVSGMWLGLNAAMPAFGWIIGSALLPLLQVRMGIPFRQLLQLFLGLSILSLIGLQFADAYGSMTALRFIFGGAIGVFFRCMEFWINAASQNEERGRNLGLYNILFMIAIIIGATIQPLFGTAGWAAFGPPLALFVGAFLVILFWSGRPSPVITAAIPPGTLRIVWSVPLALLAVLAYGIYESVPATLLPVYAVRNGLDETVAAQALAAAAFGNILMQYPVAMLSDSIGRRLPLLMCASIVALTSAAFPYTLGDTQLFLAVVALWGGGAGAAYCTALAMIGDRYKDAELVVANAAFGVVYAIGSILGPIYHGLAIDQMDKHGLMVGLALVFASLALLVAGGAPRHAQGRIS